MVLRLSGYAASVSLITSSDSVVWSRSIAGGSFSSSLASGDSSSHITPFLSSLVESGLLTSSSLLFFPSSVWTALLSKTVYLPHLSWSGSILYVSRSCSMPLTLEKGRTSKTKKKMQVTQK